VDKEKKYNQTILETTEVRKTKNNNVPATETLFSSSFHKHFWRKKMHVKLVLPCHAHECKLNETAAFVAQ
jgi:hypothetical protein